MMSSVNVEVRSSGLKLPFSIGFPYGGCGCTVGDLPLLTRVKLNVNVRISADITRRVDVPYRMRIAKYDRRGAGGVSGCNETSKKDLDSSREPSSLTERYLEDF